MAEMRKAFVCGHPVAHSRSPLIHRHWLAEHGIEGSYDRVDITPDDFPAFLNSLPQSGFAGGNVTLPHKEAACRLVAARDEASEIIGAVNTLWMEDGKVLGGNTDAYGFAAGLDHGAPGWAKGRAATVLGAGGAARAVIYALQLRGYRDIHIVNRTLERAALLRDRFRAGASAHDWQALPELLSDSDLLVNTTALGMQGKPPLEIDLRPLPDRAIVSDIVYVPLDTQLLLTARSRRLKAVDGLWMLLHQAVPGFERWFGVRPSVTGELRAAILSDLEQPA